MMGKDTSGWSAIAILTMGIVASNASAQPSRIPLPTTNLTDPPQTCPVMKIGTISPGVYNYYAAYYGPSVPCNGAPTPTTITGDYTVPQYCPDCVTTLRVAGNGSDLVFPGRKKAVEPTHDPRYTGDGALADVPAEMLKFSEFLPAEEDRLRFYLMDEKDRRYVCYRVRITFENWGDGREFPLEREIFFGYEMRSDAKVLQTVYPITGLEPAEGGVPAKEARAFRCDLPQQILRAQYGRGDVKQVLLLQVK